MPAGTELILHDPNTTVVVVRGGCVVRTVAGTIERIEAGSVVVHADDSARFWDAPIARAMMKIQANPQEPWTVHRLAHEVGLSRASFARRFVAALHRSPKRYWTELRLAQAAARLETSNESIAEIARSVGYQSEFSFSRAFKRHHGLAPCRFRRLRRTESMMAQPTMCRAA